MAQELLQDLFPPAGRRRSVADHSLSALVLLDSINTKWHHLSLISSNSLAVSSNCFVFAKDEARDNLVEFGTHSNGQLTTLSKRLGIPPYDEECLPGCSNERRQSESK